MASSYHAPGERCALAHLVACSLALCFPLAAAHGKKKVVYGKSVHMGVPVVMYFEDICVVFDGFMRAGDFFEGLERTDTPSGPEFRKKSKPVNSFPEEISVEIDARVNKCFEKMPVPGLATDLMNSLRFEAEWKRGAEVRPAAVVLIKGDQPVWRELSNMWNYELEIAAKDVRLRDSLVLYIYASNHQAVRLSGHL
jgi:hypothetical protein